MSIFSFLASLRLCRLNVFECIPHFMSASKTQGYVHLHHLQKKKTILTVTLHPSLICHPVYKEYHQKRKQIYVRLLLVQERHCSDPSRCRGSCIASQSPLQLWRGFSYRCNLRFECYFDYNIAWFSIVVLKWLCRYEMEGWCPIKTFTKFTCESQTSDIWL